MFLCHIEPSREDGGTPSAKLKFKSTSELAVAKPFSDAPNLPWNRTQCKQASQPSYTSFRKQTAQYEFRPAARRDSVAARLYVDAELQMKRRLRLHVSLQAQMVLHSNSARDDLVAVGIPPVPPAVHWQCDPLCSHENVVRNRLRNKRKAGLQINSLPKQPMHYAYETADCFCGTS